jgi:hypothetical protein
VTHLRVRVLISWGALLVAALAPARSACAQKPVASAAPRVGIIDGLVTDTLLAPLGDVTVSFIGSSLRVVTGASGRFRVRDLVAGSYIMVVQRIGFEPASLRVEIAAGDTLRPSISLQPAATRLDTVAVKAQRLSPTMEEFEMRRKAGFGHFVTQAEIDKRNVAELSDLLGTVPSVSVAGGWPMNRRDSGRGCRYVVFLDGVRRPPSGAGIDDVALPKDLAGIEIYSGAATIPLQYKTSGATCGVILLWTRVGS